MVLKTLSNRSPQSRAVSGLPISHSLQRPRRQRCKRFPEDELMSSLRRLMTTTAPASVILIRIAVGAVFLSEGIQKFLFPNELGAGRFAKIGIPAPEVMGPFVGIVEIVCGSLIILGFINETSSNSADHRYVCALISTKLPILL